MTSVGTPKAGFFAEGAAKVIAETIIYTFWSAVFIIIPIILCIGLLNAAVADHCYLRMCIAMLPWNRSRTHVLSKQYAHLWFFRQELSER